MHPLAIPQHPSHLSRSPLLPLHTAARRFIHAAPHLARNHPVIAQATSPIRIFYWFPLKPIERSLYTYSRPTVVTEWIACAEFAYNNKIHSATKVSPFYANTGRHPRMGIEPRRADKSEPAKEFAECMKQIHEEAGTALSKAQDDMARYADQHRGNPPEYKVGDKVWLSTKDIKINRPSRKLAERQLGPFEIIKVISPNAVKLKLPAGFKIHDVINVSQVWLYKSPVAGQQVIPPEPIEVEGSPEYEVEEVLNSQLKRGKLEYLAKWSGYTDDHNTWESELNLVNSKEAINDFHKSNPSAPRKLCANVFEGLAFKSFVNLCDPVNILSCLGVET